MVSVMKNLLLVLVMTFFPQTSVGSDKEKWRHSTDFDIIRNSDIVGEWRYPTKSDVFGDWKYFQKKYPTPWHVEADFNNDGFLDHAWILFSRDNTKWGLHVFMSSGADSYKVITLDENLFSFFPPQRMGLSVLQPGRYQSYCAQGFGPECKDGEAEFIVISNPSIDYITFEAANSYYIWNEKVSKFDRIWMGD